MGNSRHRSPRRTVAVTSMCLGLGFSASVLSLLWLTFVLPNVLDQSGRWFQPADIWDTLPAARFAANGAFLFIYDSGGDVPYTYGPLWAVAVAPALAIGDHFELVYGDSFDIPRSTMMIPMVLVGVTAALSVVSAAVWRSTSTCDTALRCKAMAAVAMPGILVTGVWFHGEDALVTAFVLLAAVTAGPTTAALWMAAALLTKQTALAYAPALLAAVDKSCRRRFTMIAMGLPMSVMALIFVATPSSLIKSASGISPCRECFTQAMWTSLFWDAEEAVSAAPSRLLWVAASAALAYVLRQRCTDLQGLLAVLTAVGLMRCMLFEPGIYAYYWFMPMTLTTISSALSGRRLWPLLSGFAALIAWQPASVHISLPLWWLGTSVAVVVIWTPQMRFLSTAKAANMADPSCSTHKV